MGIYQYTISGVLAGEMTGRAFEHCMPHVRPGEDHLELVVSPGPSRKALKEHHHVLEIQFLQLVWPEFEKSDRDDAIAVIKTHEPPFKFKVTF